MYVFFSVLGQKRPRYEYSTEYESSNMGSDELPVVISGMNLETTATTNATVPNLNGIPSGLSDEITKAINNIDSDEFKRLFTEYQEDYTNLLDFDAPRIDRNRYGM